MSPYESLEDLTELVRRSDEPDREFDIRDGRGRLMATTEQQGATWPPSGRGPI